MPVAKKVNSEVSFTINGVTLRKGATYKIENRPDATAPSGFQKEGATKLPSADTGNSIQCNYVNNVWDTGMHAYSPCYSGEDKKSVEEKLKMIKSHVVEPFEAYIGEQGILSHQNNKFWEDKMIDLWSGRYFKTDEPEDMLDLYIALMAGELCPEDDKGNPRYDEADFLIVDKVKESNIKQKRNVSKIDAIGNFYVLLNENPAKLMAVLKWIGISNLTDRADDKTVKTMFNTWIENSDKNVETFTKLLEDCEEHLTEEAVYLYSNLRKIFESGKGLRKNQVGDYTHNGQPLGKDLKQIAKNLVLVEELGEVKGELVEIFESIKK